MHFYKILFSAFIIRLTLTFQNDIIINQSLSNHDICYGIIKNYINNYFENEYIHVSLIIPPLKNRRNAFHEEFLYNSFNSSLENVFQYNIMHEFDSTFNIYRQAFNLIFIDDINALL